FTAASERELSECVWRNRCLAAGQMNGSTILEVEFTTEDDENSKARVERCAVAQCDALQPEICVCSIWQNGRPEPCRTHQLRDLIATSATACNHLQRQLKSQPKMSVMIAVKLEVPPLQQD